MSQSSLGAMVACDGRSLAGPTHLSVVCERRSTDRSRSTACMFTRMLQQARRTPEQFTELAAELFRVTPRRHGGLFVLLARRVSDRAPLVSRGPGTSDRSSIRSETSATR